jgi:peptidoglycan hydrolase-like protein with peptidoglycan-binding domain
MTYKDNVGLVAWCRSKIGAGYVYGTYFRVIITKPVIMAQAYQYPLQFTPTYIQRSLRWIGHEAGDCVGLIKGYYWFNPTIKAVEYKFEGRGDLSANGMYLAGKTLYGKTAEQNKGLTWGAISTIPNTIGVLVWYDGHIGVYIGNGEVIESRGVDYGVVKTRLNERRWTNWCLCPFITYQKEGIDEPMLYKGCPEGKAVFEWQESLLKTGFKMTAKNESGVLITYPADSKFGSATENGTNDFKRSVGLTPNGVVDAITYAYMLDALQNKITGITIDMLNAEVARTREAKTEALTYKTQVDNLSAIVVAKTKLAEEKHDMLIKTAQALDVLDNIRTIY